MPHSIIKVLVLRDGKKEKLTNCGQGTTNWGISSRLSASGVKSARHLATKVEQLIPGCTTFGCSPIFRAQETLFNIMEEMGVPVAHFDKVYFSHGFWSFSPEVWYMNTAPSRYSNRRIYRYRPEAVAQEGAAVIRAVVKLQEIAKGNNQESALAISHGGPLDAAIMVAKHHLGQKNARISNLKVCEGAIFHFGALNRIVRVEDVLHN